ncbi:MAG: CBS domain-containing protein [Betaproteobacteria bacterium]|nr:MAG: CBS domain-containing protein [Betaproteobacteria bacterium]
MKREYQPLVALALQTGAQFHRPGEDPARVSMDSPALSVMTDLRQIPAATIDLEAPLDAANRFMIRRGVRLLLVTDDDRQVLGLITSNDISGEKPVKFALERGVRHQDIRVRDIMTVGERLEVLLYTDLVHAEVGHVVATLKHAGRQHALVVDLSGDGGAQALRGIFSASKIARQLGMAIQAPEVAQTFAEIEAALGR